MIGELETEALIEWLAGVPVRVSSAIFRTEVLRATRRAAPAAVARARAVVANVALLSVDDEVLALASDLQPTTLRTLDALHLASALNLGGDLEAIVTYDRRMVEAGHALGLPIVSPG